MSLEMDGGIKQYKYNLVSIEKIDTPEGMPAGNWYHYVVARGSSIMEGMKSGSLSEVRKYAEEFVEGLNERGLNGRSAYSPRKKK